MFIIGFVSGPIALHLGILTLTGAPVYDKVTINNTRAWQTAGDPTRKQPKGVKFLNDTAKAAHTPHPADF